jgi:hypothetical protein
MTELLPLTVFTGWLASGERGLSSETIVSRLTGAPVGRPSKFGPVEPRDPADFRRCERLLREVPLARFTFERMRDVSPVWSWLVDEWDDLVALLEEEAPGSIDASWPTGSAPRLYERMKKIRRGENPDL